MNVGFSGRLERVVGVLCATDHGDTILLICKTYNIIVRLYK